MKYDYIIGIDPGTKTGYAVWTVMLNKLWKVETRMIHEVMFEIRNTLDYKLLVCIEDARLRIWFGKGDVSAKQQGAGSIKRDCAIWEDFCKDMGIDFELVAPKDTITKLSAESFRNVTGWQGKTTEHSRDAAMLVFDYK